MLNVVIVEDDATTGRLLRQYIEGDGIRIADIFTSGEDALRMLSSGPLPDVVLMDIGLPGMSGIETTKRLKALHPGLEVVIQTVFEDSKTILEAIRAGASGYILKAASQSEIINALWEVKRGGSFLSGKVARKVLQEFCPDGDARGAENTLPGRFGLTAREEDILKELISGASYREIGERLNISVHTVNNHIRKIYEKMRVKSRGEAVARAICTSTDVPLPGSE